MENESGVSRRQVLAGLAATGVLGGVSGAATNAYLSDDEELPERQMGAGVVDLELAWQARTNGETVEELNGDDERAGVRFQGIGPEDRGMVTFALRSCGSPAEVWMRVSSDEDSASLREAFDVDIRRYESCDGSMDAEAGEPLTESGSGSLASRLDGRLGEGIPIVSDTEACIRCEPTCVGFGWSLVPSASPLNTRDSPDPLALTFEFNARQCRHNQGQTNPWGES